MRVGVIGHFGGKKNYNDGQTIKTKNIYNALVDYGCGNFKKIDKIDTYYIKHNPIVFLFTFIKCVFFDKKIIVLLSKNGRRVLFPILYLLSILGKDIYHYGIGGRLAREVKQKPKWKRYVSSFKGNWMESELLASTLRMLGIDNAIYVPNFKKLTTLSETELKSNFSEPYMFCIFSRIMKEKGIEDAINAILMLNDRYSRTVAKLDLFGPIEESYKSVFETIIAKNSSVCRYLGVVPAEKSVEAIKDYYYLLFPTHWRHEGIPGTIIDALTAGVPIIARQWQYCDEMIEDGKTGLVYDFDSPQLLVEKMELAINNREQIIDMKRACIDKATEYSERNVMEEILNLMN